MNSEIVTIGDEIVSGDTVDTNAAFLAAALGDLGLPVGRVTSVGDDASAIAAAVKSAAARAPVVVVTGGLGTTPDDITKAALARELGLELVVDSDLEAALGERFLRRGRKEPELIRSLATVPAGSRYLENPIGGAAALRIDHATGRIYLLPGVPEEVRAILRGPLSKELGTLEGRSVVASRLIRTVGMRESDISAMLGDVRTRLGSRLASLPLTGLVDLRLTAGARTEEETRDILDRDTRAILKLIGEAVYSTAGVALESVVAGMLMDSGTTIAVAESCTGGLIGHMLTDVPGVSAVFDRALVTYSNRAKTRELGVPGELIAEKGAVSREVAQAMAEGVRERAGTDLGLATTGIAGPSGGSTEKPVGLVFTSLSAGGRVRTERRVFPGAREAVKRRAAVFALNMMRLYLLGRGQSE
jgi:nicotinamide-nucleotide amidase